MMKKNQILALTGAACMSIALLAGCGGSNNDSNNEASTNDGEGEVVLSGTVATGGSTSMQKLMSMLQEDFMAKNSGVDVTYDPTGSGAGITAATEGTCDIGMSSRELKQEEIDAGLTPLKIADDGIAVIVNLENPVEDITSDEIMKIYTGEINKWSELA